MDGGDEFYATDGLAFEVSAGTLTMESSQQMESLDIGAGASVVVAGGGGKVLVTRGLTIAGTDGAWTGALDLNDNDLIVDYAGTSPEPAIVSQLSGGIDLSGALWTGSGIRSSSAAADSFAVKALGEGEASALGLGTVDTGWRSI